MGNSRRLQRQTLRRWALVCLFLLAFLPRAIYPVSRPLQWYFRSGEFVQAILHGDWTDTLLSEHPGVTVMWLSGATLWGWYGLQALAGLNAPTPLETEGYAFADRLAVGVLPLALIIALGIVWGWHLLRRLFGEKVAWIGALLWALDPFFLANSKVLHLDATLSILMLLSALWMLIYVQEKGWPPSRRKPLILSASLGGLAILTKVTALFLVPFVGLCLLVDWLSLLKTGVLASVAQGCTAAGGPAVDRQRLAGATVRPERRRPDGRGERRSTSGRVDLLFAARDFGLWLLVAIGVCLALWPSLWVQPGASLDLVFRQGILLHTGGPRDQPIFYRGTLGVQDPGPRFYLDTLLHRTTFLTLPLSVMGLLSFWFQRCNALTASASHHNGKDPPRDVVYPRDAERRRPDGRAVYPRARDQSPLLLLSFAVFYVLQMSLGGWKDSRYMLPVLLVLDIFAAHGVVWFANRVGHLAAGFLTRHASRIITAGLIGAQACIVLLRHPYYGTHYNELLGGMKAAATVFPLAEFGEGLDLAGQYVDDRVGAQGTEVGTQFLANEMVAQHVRAPVYDVAQGGEDADYLVFGVQYTMRGTDYPRWGELWYRTYRFREPAFVAGFGERPYAWVHRPDAQPTVPQPVDARLGESIRLVGYRLADDEVAPGETLLLTLYWRVDAPIDNAYTVFTHLQGREGRLIAQQDNPPGRGARPTDDWMPGVLVEDPYELEIPPDVAPGEYTISTGMYDPATVERLPAFDAEGRSISNDRLVLTNVRVRPRVSAWRRALSAAWLALVAISAVCPPIRSRGERER